jgi:hypothetical protein
VRHRIGSPYFQEDLLDFGGGASAIVLYVFDLFMLRGEDVRRGPLDHYGEQRREIMQCAIIGTRLFLALFTKG